MLASERNVGQRIGLQPTLTDESPILPFYLGISWSRQHSVVAVQPTSQHGKISLLLSASAIPTVHVQLSVCLCLSV